MSKDLKLQLTVTCPSCGNLISVTTAADERRRQRSKTFPGIARAIATQWSEYILTNK